MIDDTSARPLSELMTELGFIFNDPILLEQAFTHRSHRNNGRSGGFVNYERLEFLGDSILGFLVAEYLVAHYANKEGELSIWFHKLVSNKYLTQVSEQLGLPDFLLEGERAEWESDEKVAKRKADVVEALVGAIYLDQGYGAAKKFVEEHILSGLDDILSNDPVVRFKQLVLLQYGVELHEVVSDAEDEDGKHLYHIDGYIGDEIICSGEGKLLRDAHVALARAGLAARFPEVVLSETDFGIDTTRSSYQPGSLVSLVPTTEPDLVEMSVPNGTDEVLRTALFLTQSMTFRSLSPELRDDIITDLQEEELPLLAKPSEVQRSVGQ